MMEFVFFYISLTLNSSIYHILYRIVWMHLMAPNVSNVYTISESIFPKVLDLMNRYSES